MLKRKKRLEKRKSWNIRGSRMKKNIKEGRSRRRESKRK
jgi:hypothetical protein